jgi:TRAP-type C4-dicarboxylate transport system permease small subunit
MGTFFVSLKNVVLKTLEVSLIIVIGLLVVDILWGVFSRFVMGSQSSWTEELARILLIWTSFLGASLAFGCKAHLGLDYLSEKFHPQARRCMALVVGLAVLSFAFFILLMGGWELVQHSLEMEQRMMAIPFLMKGHVYMVVPLSGCFTILFTLEQLIEEWAHRPEEVPSC